MARIFGVVRWSPERDGPMGSEHIGRVCEIVGENDGRVWLRLPERQLAVDPDLVSDLSAAPSGTFSDDRILRVGQLPLGVGDDVLLEDGRRAKIVDCVWHYAKAQPMYFLGFDRKLSGRRYFAQELSAAPKDF